MASSEALVPTGRPQGERQKLEQQMQLAGVPKAPPQGGSPTLPAAAPSPAAGPTTDPGGVPSGFDVFAGREPTQPQMLPPPQTTTGVIQDVALNSPNPFYREFAARLEQLRT